MLRIFKKEPKARVVSAAEIRGMREAFEQAMDNRISDILESHISDINEQILSAGRNLQTSTTYWLLVPEEEDKNIDRTEFCSYVSNYFQKLGYGVSFSYCSWRRGDTKCFFEYKLYLQWTN